MTDSYSELGKEVYGGMRQKGWGRILSVLAAALALMIKKDLDGLENLEDADDE